MALQGSLADSRARQQQDILKLDSQGNWYQGDYPILHERTCSYLHKHIDRDKEGRYFLTGEDKPIPIQIEDVPFWITKIEKTIAGFLITLTDETIELLDPETLWQGKRGALYCLVKGGGLPAKFQRGPYYEITRNLEKRAQKFYLVLSGKGQCPKRYLISKMPPSEYLQDRQRKGREGTASRKTKKKKR